MSTTFNRRHQGSMSFSYHLPMISGKSNSMKLHRGVINCHINRSMDYNLQLRKESCFVTLYIFIVLFSADASQIDAAKAIVKAITFKYSADDFDNPSLQKHYANIEAMALDRDAPEEVDDLTRECPNLFKF